MATKSQANQTLEPTKSKNKNLVANHLRKYDEAETINGRIILNMWRIMRHE